MDYSIDYQNETDFEMVNNILHLLHGNIISFFENIIENTRKFEETNDYIENMVSAYLKNINEIQEPQEIAKNKILSMNLESAIREIKEISLKKISNYQSEDFENPSIQKIILAYNNIYISLKNIKTKIIVIPSSDNEKNEILESNNSQKIIDKSKILFRLNRKGLKDEISIKNVFNGYEKAIIKSAEYPGVLLIDDETSCFIPIKDQKDINNILFSLDFEKNAVKKIEMNWNYPQSQYAYIIHLSDLHFGNSRVIGKSERLLNILENIITSDYSNSKIISVISGDLVDSPNNENYINFNNFKKKLEDIGVDKVVYVYGNHDINTKGLNFTGINYKNISDIHLESKIEIIEPLKIIIIKFNSTCDGNFARGEITENQIIAISNELDSLLKNNSEYKEYQQIAILHHHPIEIKEPDWFKKEWYQRFLPFEKTMELIDSGLFLNWIAERGIKLVLHGHKHIPNIKKIDNTYIIASGSSTGEVKHKEKNKTYLSFNILCVDTKNNKIESCIQYYEDVIGAGIKHLRKYTL